MFVAALAAAAAGWGIRFALPEMDLRLAGIAIFTVYGLVYFAVAAMLRLDEIQGVATRARRLAGR